MSDQITILADYFSLANEIIQPEKYVSTSRYFCMRWEPELGLVGARIVRVLRALGFYDHKTGETRDGIPIDLPELARLCGVSVATIKREFGSGKDGGPANPHLHTFVQREKNYRRDSVTGQIWREENIYRVKMDDPIHPGDMPRLQELWEARQKGAPKPPASGPAAPKPRKAQNEPNANPRKAQSAPKASQSAPKRSQVDSDRVQNEPALTDYSSPPLSTKSSSSDISASLFEEENREPEVAGPPAWADLAEPERAPWLDRARAELVAIHAGSGITPKPKLVEVRARNLYEAQA